MLHSGSTPSRCKKTSTKSHKEKQNCTIPVQHWSIEPWSAPYIVRHKSMPSNHRALCTTCQRVYNTRSVNNTRCVFLSFDFATMVAWLHKKCILIMWNLFTLLNTIKWRWGDWLLVASYLAGSTWEAFKSKTAASTMPQLFHHVSAFGRLVGSLAVSNGKTAKLLTCEQFWS